MQFVSKSSQLALGAWIAIVATSCSKKSDFSDRYRGEDPLNAADASGADPYSGEKPPQIRVITDSFDQSDKTKLDVLWVIDNSASMAPYQELLADNIDSFLNVASDWKADIQMAVTSTDMCTAKRPSDLKKVMCPDKAETNPGLQGKIAGGKVIKGIDDNARENFEILARLGIGGSSFEHGLSAAKAAIDLSLSGQNNNLLRQDSFLSVVIVSDEEDDGVGLSRTDEAGQNWWDAGKTRYRFTADDLVSYLRTIRPNGQFSVSSVVGFSRAAMDTGPCGSSGSLEAGSEQLRASALSGGFKLDICSTDWSAGLGAMAENFASQLSSFKLSAKPLYFDDIEVRIDGEIKKSGWSYVDSRQSIVFDASEVPVFGAQIEVRYAY